MPLTDARQINAAKKGTSSRTGALAVGVANAVLLDDENALHGVTRKIRKLILQNLDNNIVEVGLATSTAAAGAVGTAAAGPVALNHVTNLSQYGQFVWDSDDPTETVQKILAITGGIRRFAIYHINLSAAAVRGVQWVVEYYDDQSN